MAENDLQPPKPQKPVPVLGLDKPFSAKEAEETDGVDNETGLFHGIDPESKERVSVTLQGLKAEFGNELGEKKYLKIAGIAGGSVFFNPGMEATSFRPALGLSGLRAPLEFWVKELGAEEGAAKFAANQKHAAEVTRILAEKE